MNNILAAVKTFFKNKWVKFTLVSVVYLLIFVVWSRIWWSAIGVAVIYDLYISKYYYRLFWQKHLERKKRNKTYKSVSGWVEAIVFAVVVATLIRTYFVEMYVIPSPSMEKTLMVGDYIGVNKVSYGPKLPNTPLAIPLVHNTNPLNPRKKSYLDWIQLPYKRLAGLDTIKRHDVVVFNYPEGDTVLVESPQNDYYSLVRSYGREYVEKQSKIIYHPVDKRDNYIKRAIGLPGDTIELRSGEVFVNGIKEDSIPGQQYLYVISHAQAILPPRLLEKAGISEEDIMYKNDNMTLATLTNEQVRELEGMSGIVSITREMADMNQNKADIFPHDPDNYPWSENNFGPLYVPRKGATVPINERTIALYRRIIANYEGNKLEEKPEGIFINGEKADSYTFRMNYFFMMGDNRQNSRDSRYFGFVPEDHVVGKASFIWFSSDKSKGFPKNIRFRRLFRSIE